MKKILSVTFFTGMLTLSRMMAGLLVSKIIAIYIGTTGMALLGQVQNLITMLNGVINSPASNSVIRYTAENYENGYEYCAPWWRASLQWIISLSCLIVPIGIIFSQSISELLFDVSDYSWLVCLIFSILPISAVSTLVNSVLNGHQDYRKYIVLGMFSVLTSTLLMVLLIIFRGSNGALVAAAVQSGIIGLAMLIFCIKEPWLKVRYWWGVTSNEHRKKVGGYILMAVTSAICMPAALILVRKIIISNEGWNNAGQWQAVWKISEVYLSVLTTALGVYFLPHLSKLKKCIDIRKEINSTAVLVVPIVILLATLVYLFRDFIITVLFTDDFRNARNLFLIQLIGDVLKITSWLYAYPMISKGKTKLFIGSEVFFALLFVGLSALLIPIFHTQGANLAYTIMYIFYLVFVLSCSKYILRDDYENKTLS
ncbi:O-antigen translocase [Escherichia coli]|uniref:O-antigen translocase n=1 Tax=Escherichia coli TaxID=562 RepID=UPI0027E1FAC8|nr:O-antigen translocase [Escherichia coli]